MPNGIDTRKFVPEGAAQWKAPTQVISGETGGSSKPFGSESGKPAELQLIIPGQKEAVKVAEIPVINELLNGPRGEMHAGTEVNLTR